MLAVHHSRSEFDQLCVLEKDNRTSNEVFYLKEVFFQPFFNILEAPYASSIEAMCRLIDLEPKLHKLFLQSCDYQPHYWFRFNG